MRVRKWKRELGLVASIARRRPFNVLIQVTNRCNMRCAFCTFWENGVRPERELTVDDYIRLERDLSRMGRFAISIEGGEPLVRPDLVDIVRVLSARHTTILYTNGWYMTEDKASALFAAGLTQVGVSVDFPDARRHDAKRGLDGAFERAWRAVRWLRDAADDGNRQVHVMTVYMEENRSDLEELLELSAAHGVGHYLTLVATSGARRAPGGSWPESPVSEYLLDLWDHYPHFRGFREYLALMDTFLGREGMAPCRAGVQSFNIDHLGNVAPCIEKIDKPAGNIRDESLMEIHARLRGGHAAVGCQDCWTMCRSMNHFLGDGGTPSGWRDFVTRLRGY